jgi:hypothetical protein
VLFRGDVYSGLKLDDDRKTGDFDLEAPEVDIGMPGDEDDDDYYPDEYY